MVTEGHQMNGRTRPTDVPGGIMRCGRMTRGLRRGHDRGAVAGLVAVLLSTGVLLGMAALSVDVGQLYAERRQVQNGADAAALAVAVSCAASTTCTSSTGG